MSGLMQFFTDFGQDGPYVGQMHAAALTVCPQARLVDLMHDAPRFDLMAASVLLAALARDMPLAAMTVAVVDPGVGTERPAVMVEADGRFFVGPGNAIFTHLARFAGTARAWRIDWQPDRLSRSFHGRDLFTPFAARILDAGLAPPEDDSLNALDPGDPAINNPDWPDNPARIVYVDHYGNAMTGLRASALDQGTRLWVGGMAVDHAPVFAAVPEGHGFWYENSSGLAEIAVNRGSAAGAYGLSVSMAVRLDRA